MLRAACLAARPPAAAGRLRACACTSSAAVPGPLHRISVVLCNPQGPANVGGTARVLQCFGLSDLRVVSPGPHVVEATPPHAFVSEAVEYSVSARGLLEASSRHRSALEACADAQLVFATSARNRDSVGGLRQLTPRQAAAEAAACAARGGRVAVLFGNERTGLSNAELELAHALVCVPTAGSQEETPNRGAGGRFSLNLSHAVSVCAYELYQACEEDRIAADSAAASETAEEWALNTGGRAKLVSDLSAACRALKLRYGPLGEEEAEAEAAELRALGRTVSGAMMSRRAAAPLFQLARRVLALQEMQGGVSPLDAPVLAAAAEALRAAGLGSGKGLAGGGQGGSEVRAKAGGIVQAAFRESDLNLSKRELERLLDALASE